MIFRMNPSFVAICLSLPLALSVACSNVDVPDGVLLTCTSDSDCPGDTLCEPTTQLCVSEGGEDLLLLMSSVSPLLVGTSFFDASGQFEASISLSAAPLVTPDILLLDDQLETVATFDVTVADAGSGSIFSATLLPEVPLPEGRLLVAIDLVDSRGVPTRVFLDPIEVDLTPPQIVGTSLQRLPDPQLTPVAFEIAGASGPVGRSIAVRVGFSATEPIFTTGQDSPRVSLDGSDLEFARDPSIENPYFFDLVWPDGDAFADGTFPITARIVDLAGNVTERSLTLSDTNETLELVVDTTSPPLPDTATSGLIVFERAPWGRQERSVLETYTVIGGPGSVAPNAFVLVTRDPEGIREIGRTRADGTGAFGGFADLPLATGDLPVAYLVLADDAGNFTAPTPVSDGLWIATVGGKVAGNRASNPHVFEDVPINTMGLIAQGVTELDASDGLGQLNGEAAVTSGAATWTRLASDESDSLSPLAGVLVEPAFGHNPATGESILFGGSEIGKEERGGSGDVAEARCQGATGDIWRRGFDGRFRREEFSPGQTRPSSMRGARFAFEPDGQRLLLLGQSSGGSQMWALKDGLFSRLCTEEPCASSLPGGLYRHGFVHDPIRRTFLLHLPGSFSQTYSFDGDTWTLVCGGDTSCTPPNSDKDGTLVFDETRRQPVWFDGQDLFAWTSNSWEQLCVDAPCQASRPPARFDSALAFDRHRGVLVAFGGQGDYVCDLGSQLDRPPEAPGPPPPFADTWEFDGTSWTQRVPDTTPPGRALHIMGWDETRGRVIMSGGDDCNCMQQFQDPGFRSGWDEDFWEWDGTDWTRVDQAPTPPDGFTPESSFGARDHAATAAPALGGVVFYGDQDGDGALHVLRQGRFYQSDAPVSGLGSFLPGLTTAPDGTVFASGGGGADGGGGGPSGAPFMHRLNGNTIVSDCSPDPFCGRGPQPQPLGHAFAHDGLRLVQIGGALTGGGGGGLGFSFSDLGTDTITTYDATDGFLSPCAGGACGQTPGARMRPQLAWTGTAGETLLFGGSGGDTDTWTFDGTTWTVEAPATVPPRRQGHILVYDAGRQSVVLASGTPFSFNNDTRSGEAGAPIPPTFTDVYEWVDGDWVRARIVDVDGDGAPALRYGAAGAHDPEVGGVMLHGGTPSPEVILADVPTINTTRLDDVWHWRGGETTRPAQRFRVSMRAANLGADQAVRSAEVRWHAAGTLRLWDGFGWTALATASCGDGCQSATLDGDLVRQATFGDFGELVFSVEGDFNPVAPNYATVATDYVEVRVRYR